MSLSTWKQFRFFDSIPIRDPSLGSDSLLYSDPTLSAISPIDSDRLVIAVQSNVIKVISINEACIKNEFKAFENDYQISYLRVVSHLFLVVVGECTGKPSFIKVIKLDNIPKDETAYHSLIEVKSGDNNFPISGISVSDDLFCIAIGYINGKVLLIRGDIPRDRGSRQRIIYDDIKKEPITSLSLNKDATLCYVATTSKIMLFETTGRNAGQPTTVLNNESGLDLNCGYYSMYTNEFITCLKDKIEFYKNSGEKSFVLYGEMNIKRVFPISKRYLLLFTEPVVSNDTSLNIANLSKPISIRVLILDLTYKTIAFSSMVKSTIVDVFMIQDTSDTYYLNSDGILNKLTEKPYDMQIDIVLQKEMFQFALKLATAYNLSDEYIKEIHKRYGDYLFNKNKVADATEEYIKAFDVVETSEIIAKLGMSNKADSNNLQNLTDYLCSLVKTSKANADHVTLLLVTYIKLQDMDQFQYFIKHFTRLGKFNEEPIEEDIDDETYFYSNVILFNLDLIINLLEESNFIIEAYELAKRFAKDPVSIIEILLNKLNNPATALEYIKTLEIDNTLRVLVLYSKELLEMLPNETNSLLIDVFTGKYHPNKALRTNLMPTEKLELTTVRKVFYSYTEFFGYKSSDAPENSDPNSKLENATYHPPKPSLIFNSFLSRPFEFIVFLEACLDTYQRYGGLDNEKQALLITLYDLYLDLSKTDIDERQLQWKNKAMHILEESNKLAKKNTISSTTLESNSDNADNSLMMLISHMNDIDIYTSTAEPEIRDSAYYINQFQSLIYSESPTKVLDFLEKYGRNEPSLYESGLRYFISSKDILDEIGGEKVLEEKVLNIIVRDELLTMIDIVQLLSVNDVAKYGLLKNILLNYMSENENEINNNKKLIKSYKCELTEKKNTLANLLDPDNITKIKIKNEKCDYCKANLEIPIIYFQCGHTYHERCLNKELDQNSGDEVYVCPKCIANKESTEALFNKQKDMKESKELIEIDLKNAKNGSDCFKVVADFIGRGALNNVNTNI
ncbi:hypothetical protein TPHA_0J01570 [Tetrapisispora phaffii CBS 4417]|uniref:E3 ubiquitin-protein ligase PEP5 n=1 Tax=Tetrapisispora phaffii (strain ATCC 24235 / CBS 4417 / NBRC 1672 / NRRL Y-8282 / UCD 70-5) TaxID=1071381 RepID=G8BYN6_TETPH|nr:hypothetical protein TPHA_0J01570 [Tetrapisispora phaffii CBS 4417]CCE64978.1 hypothetical protein TPHA_0J01570 [Tetrapisispora phaffii CBS 4417]